ncbi:MULTISPECIES: response regulator transcription factor [Malaciobacter]|jgi:DNA-binding response OmpR family regulator|uniref:DNA-binding response OmpR family regulator n=2 Tax=Malaciobacter TaxID=2321114 RepID=A0AB36ZX43_9BACT|nr:MULTISPECIES: response regulator [Malaciobacter]PHO08930.1 DNA-binding response regulator [Malaciobacter canalis]PPK61256.1 DNA-binding response OmpR family regulator [Malaciobacter marinus]QEE32867.1 two-component system response regulator [Malaciobacter canalis]SKB60722.1 DNA-binding response regulator, OmpR family, contains REC and winged-helix (wHTH) domain [Malaciobacter marinus]
MLKTEKNIRKLYNAKLLIISNDDNVKVTIENEFDDYFKELKLVNGSLEALELAVSNSYDLVIIDTNVKDYTFDEICTEISNKASNLPKIIISDEENNNDILTAINCSAYTFISKPLRAKDVKLAIIMCLNQTKRGDKIEFQNGIYFDEYRDQFFKPGGVLIDFTRLEKSFLKLLIEKRGEITDYDTIKDVVWKGKNMSIYTMRNIVNKIRQKTYYEIIRNHSNKGYVLEENQK